ncbi:MAG: CoA transferase subunit A [Candidatus Muirbacterium halophilum]|nr:CoA transferase subunit A [Candidatus Muirbacterium halophilum]MCK9475144.1 CoA transferase subunit A [Candidatus Muirbacterium halophilum]
MKKVLNPADSVKIIKDGATIMISGFMCCGQPLSLIDALVEQGTKDLTIICNDAGYPDKPGVGRLIVEKRVKKLIASHIGLNPIAGQQMNSGELEVILVPQGSLAEKIRAGGTGLGGILTPTGVGTEVEKGKKIIEVDGIKYILEEALKAEFSLISSNICDEFGNAFIAKSAKNFNVVMAMAGENTIIETKKLVKTGQIENENITVPGVFVNTIVVGGKND